MIEPIDVDRCQATRPTTWTPMSLGPKPTRRCTNRPVAILVEKEPDASGERGAMSICGNCQDFLPEDLTSRLDLFWIAERSR